MWSQLMAASGQDEVISEFCLKRIHETVLKNQHAFAT